MSLLLLSFALSHKYSSMQMSDSPARVNQGARSGTRPAQRVPSSRPMADSEKQRLAGSTQHIVCATCERSLRDSLSRDPVDYPSRCPSAKDGDGGTALLCLGCVALYLAAMADRAATHEANRAISEQPRGGSVTACVSRPPNHCRSSKTPLHPCWIGSGLHQVCL